MTRRLADLIQEEAAGPCPAGYDGEDWFQLSQHEEEVFGIDADRVPVMVAAWEAYEALIGRTSGTRWDMKHQPALDMVKAERPDILTGDDEHAWSEFAAAYGGLTNREAWQWYAKHEAWLQRAGILIFKDDS